MKHIVNSRFFKIGSVVYHPMPESVSFSDVATFDATIYADNQPRLSMIRDQTSIRPHLVRNLNLLDTESKKWLQNFWDRADRYVRSIGNPYQCFLVITGNQHSVASHSHGEHLGDTVTVVSVQGNDPVDTHLVIDGHKRLQYPDADDQFYAVCFDSNVNHGTDSHDHNLYFHFVYDLSHTIDVDKNVWLKI